MKRDFRNLLKELTPPLVWKCGAAIRRQFRVRPSGSVELVWQETAAECDALYSDLSDRFGQHYTTSPDYFLWCVLVDRLLRGGVRSVLEVGCGAGQLACFLRDRGVPRYLGIDFSKTAIQLAELACPEFRFLCSDVFQRNAFVTWDHDVFVSTEFLEHVPNDLDLLRSLRSGVKAYCTVPNFPWRNHLRHFRDCREVRDRYGGLFSQFEVVPLLANSAGRMYFLFQGIRSDGSQADISEVAPSE
jgi:SAM-dependent methyltransferase